MTVFALAPGGEVRRITPEGVFLQAHVHPSGNTAVLWGGPTGEPRLWQARTDGSEADDLGPWRGRHPVYDASGLRVAFVLGEASDPVEEMGPRAQSGMPPPGTASQIAILDIPSCEVEVITEGESQDQRPCWSPDGSRIVFIRDGRLASVPSGGGDVEVLPGPAFAYRPWFALDGRELFFFTVVDGRRQVHRAPADDIAAATPFAADDTGHTHGPFADPSGEHLIVHSSRDGAWWLYELPLDGAPMRRVDIPADMAATGHGTRSPNGVLVFDAETMRD